MTEKTKKVPPPEQISPAVQFSQKEIVIAVLALIIGCLIGLTFANKDSQKDNMCGGSGCQHKQAEETNSGMHQMPDGSMMKNSGSGMGNHNMMDMRVSSEKEFLTGMIPHHQEAVDTAKEVVERGGTKPEIKQLAENIIVAQEKEIAEMKEWYKTWYGEEYKDDGKYLPMMRDLSKLSGAELDKAFLQDMIMHHMGALMMARSVKPYIEHEEMEKLTQDVLTTQSKEITQMRQMVQGL